MKHTRTISKAIPSAIKCNLTEPVKALNQKGLENVLFTFLKNIILSLFLYRFITEIAS